MAIMVGLPPHPQHDSRPDAITVDEMRQRILRGARDSGLIHHVMMQADYRGLSGEDRYAQLAYTALIELQRYYEYNSQHMTNSIWPPNEIAPMGPVEIRQFCDWLTAKHPGIDKDWGWNAFREFRGKKAPARSVPTFNGWKCTDPNCSGTHANPDMVCK